MKYRGEIGIELENIGKDPFVLKKQAKVAQIVLCPVLRAIIEEVDELDETVRGADGYGSTGSMIQAMHNGIVIGEGKVGSNVEISYKHQHCNNCKDCNGSCGTH